MFAPYPEVCTRHRLATRAVPGCQTPGYPANLARTRIAPPRKRTGILIFTGIGLIAFGCIFGAASSEERRSDLTRRAVQKLMTVIGILSALVMGLLIAG